MAMIVSQVTVVRDGMHNGFTDLQYWQGAYWVGYRKGAGHISMDAHAVVAVSHDRCRFTEIATARVKGDVRDPKLFPVNEDCMAMYFPSWTEGAGKIEEGGLQRLKPIQQYITFSGNGLDWEAPQPILEKNMWLWRVRKHGGKYYGLIQNLADSWSGSIPPHQLDLAVSDDLLTWTTLARVGDGLNESDIYWHEDGEAWIVSRTAKGEYSVFASAQAPYTAWETTDMSPLVHAPIILEHEGKLFVAGRSLSSSEGVTDAPFGNGRCSSLSIWQLTRKNLDPVLRIPAFGDCSYPGFIKDPEGRICLTYYSQHAYHLGVCTYPFPGHMPNDVYFAELEL